MQPHLPDPRNLASPWFPGPLTKRQLPLHGSFGLAEMYGLSVTEKTSFLTASKSSTTPRIQLSPQPGTQHRKGSSESHIQDRIVPQACQLLLSGSDSFKQHGQQQFRLQANRQGICLLSFTVLSCRLGLLLRSVTRLLPLHHLLNAIRSQLLAHLPDTMLVNGSVLTHSTLALAFSMMLGATSLALVHRRTLWVPVVAMTSLVMQQPWMPTVFNG